MRILTISNCPLQESLGSGYVIVNFCRGLREHGHEIDLFGPESYEPLPFLAGKAKSYRQALGMLLLARRQLRRKRYDVVEFYGAQSWLAASILARRTKRQFLMVSHSNGLETHHAQIEEDYWGKNTFDGSKRKWYQLNQRALYEKSFTVVDGIVTVCYQDVPFALQHNYQDASHVVAIDNRLPQSYLNLDVDFKRSPVVGFCGSWLERKGTAAIKEGMTKVLRQHSQWRLHLVGVGREFDKRQHFAEDVLARVDVTPRVEKKEELRAIYQQMAIFLMPSIHESFGLVAAEAMACGATLLATETGFAAKLKHGEEAWIIPRPEADELAEGVNTLVEDELLRLRIAQNGYNRVQELQWEPAIRELETLYERWLAQYRVKS